MAMRLPVEEGVPGLGGRTELVEVADLVYAYVQHDGGWCVNNAGVLVGRDAVAVVDTAATERRARRFRATIAELTAAPVRTVVNTHHHGDHTFGNAVVAPHATVIAHERARTDIARNGLGLTHVWPEVEWGRISVGLPSVTFTDRLTLHVDDTRVELVHIGPAHTTNDVVAWLPEQKVLFAGDLVLAGCTPFVLMGSLAGSIEALGELRALGARTVVCGHGPVAGPEVLDETESYLRWVGELARAGVAEGLSPLDVARDTSLGQFADLLDSERLVANLHRAYVELPAPGRETVPERGDYLPSAQAMQDMAEVGGRPLVCTA